MKVAGKCPPEKEELKKAENRGFQNLEVYLEKQHLDTFEQTVENLENSGLNISTVHTPHVTLEEKQYFLKADKLASKLNAYLVFHTAHVHFTQLEEIRDLDFDSEFGFENHPGTSLHHLEKTIIKQGNQLVLDVAHFYMATDSFQNDLEKILEKHGDSIQVIHLCDSTELQDGLPFEEGEINMEAAIQKIKDSGFDGIVTLEVMPEDQKEALKQWKSV